jgi:ectoine hydroxylase-related dioxygenase (phytanoyl-CoA dioxygenase family)
VTTDAGPLLYVPGTHRAPMFPAFDNYPQTNLKTCRPEVTKAYDRHIDRLVEGKEQRPFLAKKGQVLLFHGMLVHGGAPITRPGKTRRSFVCHYIPTGANKDADIVGPFNW